MGNCLDLLPEIEDNSIHLIITDPPYFLHRMDDTWDAEKIAEKKNKGDIVKGVPVGMKFDKLMSKKLQEFFSKVSTEAKRVLRPGGFFISFSYPRLSHRITIAMEDSGFEIRDIYAWNYRQSQAKAFTQDHFVKKMNISDDEKEAIIEKLGGRKTPQIRPQFDLLIVGQKPREGTFVENWLKWETGLIDIDNVKVGGENLTTIFKVDKEKKEEYNTHPTVKPVLLIEALIKIFSKEGQTVLDPFAGSGTTLVAAKNINRNSIGFEKVEEYCDIANKRLQ